MRLLAAGLVLCLGLQASGATDSLLEQLFGGSDAADHFSAKFAGRINRVPDVYRPPRLFLDVIAAPLQMTAPLEDFSDHLRLDGLEAAVAQWAAQYGLRADCDAARLPAPASLAQAADQVLATAVAVQALHRSVLPPRDTRALIKHFEKVQRALAEPQPGSLSWWEKRRLRRFLERLEKADLAAIACATRQAGVLFDAEWLNAVTDLMQSHSRSGERVIVRQETALGAIIFAGSADSSFQSDAVLAIFDLGGADVYGLDSSEHFSATPQWLVDLEGDDRYESSRPGGIGSGIGRVFLMLDRGGNDRYNGTTYTQAFALLGAAFMIDAAGADEYVARHYAQGAALAGVAMLLDRAGDDRYQASGLAQGLGLTAGLGALVDASGDDDYRALARRPTGYGTPGLSDAWAQGLGMGLRGLGSGGLGVLLDGAGNDNYDAGVFAQGGGYFHGAGLLLDRGAGDDHFMGSRYAQAWGAHGGLGFLDNTQGNDSYRTRHSVSAGLAWDYSLAWFRDRAGNDQYQVGDFSLGASAHVSLGFFEDAAGTDSYEGTVPARNNEGPPNLSLFVDHGPAPNRHQGVPVQPGCSTPAGQGLVIWNLLPDEPVCP